MVVLFLKGFCMGASDVVPGVSGGTMALILGVYEELIASLKAFDARFVRLLLGAKLRRAMQSVPLGFLLPLGVGILTAIFTLAGGLSWLLNHYPLLIWSFFFGLILASAILVARRIDHWNLFTFVALCVAALGAYLLVGLVPVKTPETLPFIFICGAIAICAMILPGISGSFILVLLGKYHYILDAVSRLDLTVLVVFTAGTATGIMLFVRLLNWLLQHFHQITLAALTGLMIGSLRKIWPWKSWIASTDGHAGAFVNTLPHAFTPDVGAAIGLIVLGIVAVLVLQRLAQR
jgi:putative membrane protein